jgi:hypothetical protein
VITVSLVKMMLICSYSVPLASPDSGAAASRQVIAFRVMNR